MRPPVELAAVVVRAWTRMYTGRLEPVVRDARCTEIDSDLWEHARTAGSAAADQRRVAGQMLARCLLGIAADLSWRAQMAADSGRPAKEGISMNERVKENWWIPAPVPLIGLGLFTALIMVVGDGYESPWSRTEAGWNPSSLERFAAVAVFSFVFVVMPVWALVVRRRHPGWTVAMLAPWIFVSMAPLGWSSDRWIYVIPALGLATLVGAFLNMARRSVVEDPGREPTHSPAEA